MKIACLHTAQSNVAVFNEAARALNLPQDAITHKVMPHLLEQAQAAGGVTPEIEKEAIAALADLRTDADVVLLTCSTLGPAADFLAQDPGIMRVDRALAQAAATAGQPVMVLCAAPTTLHPTAALFRATLAPTTPLGVEIIPEAWALFQSGQHEAFHQRIAQAAEQAFARGAGCVALAQASMAGAERYFSHPNLLTSPRAALAQIVARVEREHA
ncbi:glutamate racemase [Cronobacter turicensis]|uniref:glutamate racemase n=1 Tax=Cronobacter turicensis TaxID=413502 RepID=UPI0024C2E93A|nr:glutamate racemase [Cronobacter turicensis]MDK1183315.1 glutamate racemase [Cronobacter turicensis]MDK1205062.1 glutamate racemase [Cronobacter turicensis]MDK1212729.1 glutamate racemase [Cronobacter turicensis]MDK1216865.1 glutamate racemase [Cronobacter turicensis]MDK1232957.1 glutamate racemase [Cronobacter turicensis]